MVMRTLRNKVSLIIWLSAILLVALVVGLVAPGFMGDHDLSGAAAVVDGKPIDSQQFSQALDAGLEQARQAAGGELSDAQAAKVRRSVLDGLIADQLAFTHAASLGQSMSPEEFRQLLMDDPNLQDGQGHFDQERYEQLLEAQAEQGVPWQQAEANFQRALLLNKVREFWAGQAALTPAEAARAEARLNRSIRAQAIVWDLKSLARRAAGRLSKDDLETYYSLHKRDWERPEQRRLRQIQVRAALGESTATARARADAVLKRLKAGADFKALAAKDNSDPSAKASAGELGWLAREDLRHAAVADAAFRLGKGRFSGVIPTSDGFTIVEVEGVRPGFEPTFANSESLAAQALAGERAAQQALDLAGQALEDLAAGRSVAQAAKGSQGRVVLTGWFGRDDASALPALGKDPGFARALLALDKGAAIAAPERGQDAVAVAVVADERPGRQPKDAKAAAERASEALSEAHADKAKALYDAWIASLRAKADIVDQRGAEQSPAPDSGSGSDSGPDSGSD